ncbi:Leucine carboxyl methyltransferase 1 [Caenorhabditis elegans]|uniref:Leucine carboxyl methyltransferase 1 n=1 Tax=Caenorhabditis elegans TaxID=6239 RepID=LCMT1_CAEEL|nr:Leucine carboxyl methyltransferase 1 [Caenorhabditis elegans]P46554.1 RecName: Full=Leucine carboxyl methyltransferase 1; AltName: Full=[Phosphatase 2A protein]-leucine-carboxy methyltransferase 1 [Caenorhabditis elegans]CAA84295.1 Leucine carboxyl methyltransferase 1 [Caenorhabditis elegans]|eukprot:NP_497875.1 Leucine carboxyl methyltransferase 1 [Caenorhabditis elegans]
MDSEAVSSDSHVAAAIATRRRSNSVSDDYSVQRTNDDATQCKYFATQKGYWKDEFISRFANSSSNVSEARRFPEISMGYWARTAAIEKYVRDFLNEFDGNAQVVSLGCGFDTLFWRLVSSGAKLVKYVEVDFSSVTSKKIRHILKPIGPNSVDLKKSFESDAVVSHHADLHAGNYHLIGADLRQANELDQKLATCQLSHDIPTIFIAECVLVYMSADSSTALLKQIVSQFKQPAFVNYEQFRTSDAFTKVMEQNLGDRGIQLHGLEMCESAEKQEERFRNAGFKEVKVMDMNQIFNNFLDQKEVSRIREIEMLDEMELLQQLFAHYCVVSARI